MGPTKSRRPVRLAIGIAAAIVVTLVSLLALVVLKSRYEASRSEPTTPLFTAADLPAPPPDEDNGWVLVQGTPRLSLDDVARDRLLEVLDPSATLEERVAVYDRAAGTLRIEAERRASALDAFERALGRPRFADVCPLVIDAACDLFAVVHMQSAITLRALAHASAGRMPDAFRLTTQALRAYLDLAATARRLVSMVVATLAIERTLVALEVLVHLAARGQSPDSWRAPREALRAQLASWSSLDVQRPVRGEYLIARDAFESLRAESRGRWSRLVFDPHATSAVLDAYYDPLHEYAGDPSRPAPADPTPPGDVGWWQANSAGELLNLALMIDYAPRVRDLHRTDADLRARARALRQSLPPD